MSHAAARMASRDEDAGRYQRHRPEQTLLYQTINEIFPLNSEAIAQRHSPATLLP